MPVARSPADIMGLAVYALAGGSTVRGFMVTTVAQRLGITSDRATELAEAANRAGLVQHAPAGSVSLTAKGQERGTKLMASMG